LAACGDAEICAAGEHGKGIAYDGDWVDSQAGHNPGHVYIESLVYTAYIV
jgi:hypothetical protein